MNLDLVIFDCDGVLVGSEVISCRAHAQTLTRHGYSITKMGGSRSFSMSALGSFTRAL